MQGDRLKIKLREQRTFLNTSCELYDAGNEIEAIRLATTARVLLYDEGNNRGLLRQLDAKSRITWRSPRVLGLIEMGQRSRLAVMRSDIQPNTRSFKYLPIDPKLLRLDEFVENLNFDAWFNQSVFISDAGTSFSRRDFIRTLAHKEGGAHVDDLRGNYLELAQLELTNWSIDENGGVSLTEDKPIFSHMRSIAEEIRIIFEIHEELFA
jgi:hypothetical protein